MQRTGSIRLAPTVSVMVMSVVGSVVVMSMMMVMVVVMIAAWFSIEAELRVFISKRLVELWV